MNVYVLRGRTYTAKSPSELDETSSFEPADEQLLALARQISEHFGSFVVFGITLDGRMKMFKSPCSEMEELALNRFIDTISEHEADLEYSLLDDGEDVFDEQA